MPSWLSYGHLSFTIKGPLQPSCCLPPQPPICVHSHPVRISLTAVDRQRPSRCPSRRFPSLSQPLCCCPSPSRIGGVPRLGLHAQWLGGAGARGGPIGRPGDGTRAWPASVHLHRPHGTGVCVDAWGGERNAEG